MILVLSLGIKGVDIALHEGIVSVVMPQNSTIMINGWPTVDEGCKELSVQGCQVQDRANVASTGGRNASSNLAVYEVPYDPATKSVAFIGPVTSDTSVTAIGPTVAVSTNCSISNVVCNEPDVDMCNSNSSVWDVSFDTKDYGYHLQIVLASDQNLTGFYGAQTGFYWSAGTARNPMKIIGFGSFANLANIDFSSIFDQIEADHPFLSWWELLNLDAPVLGLLVFAFDCEVTVHDALYKLSNGVATLLDNTLSLANALHHGCYILAATMGWGRIPPTRGNKRIQL